MTKRKNKWWVTLLWVLGVLLLVLALAGTYANYIVAELVKKELTKPQVNTSRVIQFSDISVNLFTGSAELDSFRIASDTLLFDTPEGYVLSVAKAKVKYANLMRMLSRKQLYVNTVQLDGMKADVYLNDREAQDYSDTLGLKVYQDILKVIALLDVENVDINNASFRLRSPKNPFEIQFDSTYLYARNLRYDLRDSTFTYNDSVYELITHNFRTVGTKGLYTITANRLYTQNEEGVDVDHLHFFCNLPKKDIAEKMGKVPVDRFDVEVDKIKTTPFNLIRSVIEGHFAIDTIDLAVHKVDLYRDESYPSPVVIRPIQAMLLELDMPLKVNRIQMKVDEFQLGLKKAIGEAGIIQTRDNRIIIENFENKPANIVKMRMDSKLYPLQGDLSFNLSLHMTPACHWNANARLTKADIANFNPFAVPLMGAELGGYIPQLDARYAGDSLTCKGVVTMRYDSLHLLVLPTSPIPLFAKHHKAITNLAKAFVPKSNPRREGAEAKSYYVASERDLYKPYIFHFIQPMVVGIKQTLLGGFYLSKEVKDWKKKKNNWYEEYKPY